MNNNNIANLQNQLNNDGGASVHIDQMPGMLKTGTSYATAMQVIKERNLQHVTNKCLVEASLAGEEFYYSWSQGGNIIEGLTVGAALAIVRNYGNCSVDVKIEETATAYIFHGVFVDLETGFNLTRPFRQNKQSPKSKKGTDIYTGDRGKDIIFQIGASKAIRNVVLNACPSWLCKKVIAKSKQNVSKNIEDMGKVKALEMLEKKANNLKVPFENIERHFGISKNWDNEKLVMVSGALRSIEDGFETADSIFQGDEKVNLQQQAVNGNDNVTNQNPFDELPN